MGTSSKTPGKEIHLRDYFVVLDRSKWFIISILVVTLSVSVLYLRRQIPFYRAQASIIIEPNRSQEIAFPQSAQIINLDLKTQIQVIKTVPVLSAVVRQLGFPTTVNQLKRSISINFIGETSMVSITAVHFIPERAQAIANAVAQAYIDQDRLSRLQAGRDAVRWLSTQLADLKTKLKNSEETFQQFKEQEGMITLGDKRREELNEVYELNTTYLSARAKRLEVEAIIDKLESESHALKLDEENGDLDIPIAMLNSAVLQKLGTELSQLKTELSDKKRLFKDTYPGVIEVKDRIKLTEQKILGELERQRDFLQAQEDSFSSLQKTKHQEALKLSRKELEYLTLEREVTTNREIYNTLLSRVKEISLTGESDLNNIRIVELAELPTGSVGSEKMTLALGAVLGLFLGIGFAFFLEYMGNTIKTPDEVSQHLGLTVLGIVPRSAAAKEAKIPPIILQGSSRDVSSEAYRSLRTNLLFSGTERSMKTILFTTAGPGEGKSITVVNLGAALAQAGHNVLLVDADLRRPMLHRVFRMDKHKGLSTVLAGELTIDDVVTETDIPNLSVITSGMLPTNPSEVLGSAQMRDLIRRVREQYEIVLFDSAPILGMTDAAVLAAEMDATVLVIKAGEASRKALKMSLAQLEQVDAALCGVVLNNVDVRRDRYYDYYYYYYYSSYEDDEGRKVKRKKYSDPDLHRSDYSVQVPVESIARQDRDNAETEDEGSSYNL